METLPPKYLKPIYITGKNTVVQGNASTLSQYQKFLTTTTGTAFTTGTESYTTGSEANIGGGAEFTTGVGQYTTGAEFTTGAESYTTGAEQYATGAEQFTAGAGQYTTGAEFTTGAESYTTGAEQYTTGAEQYTTGAEQFTTGAEQFSTGAQAFTTGSEFTQSTFDAQQTYNTTQTTSMTTGAQPAFKLIRRGSGISPNEQEKIVQTATAIMQQGITPVSNNTASGVKKVLGGDWLVIVYPQGKPIDFNMTCVQGNDYMYFTLDSTAFQVCRLR
jgi:X-X-X-Leu-X-X-Gly heptad repeat protein